MSPLATALHRIADAVVLVHPYMVGVVRNLSGKPVLYESLNVETELKRMLLIGHPEYRAMVQTAEECEREAIKVADALIAVSVEDEAGLIGLGADPRRLFIVPNGVDVPVNRPDADFVRALGLAGGVRVDTLADKSEIVPGETLLRVATGAAFRARIVLPESARGFHSELFLGS